MTSRIDKAIACHAQQFNCAQAVFSTYAPALGISELDSLKMSAGFGGGMGRLQEVCGAVTGALMLIGCKYGMVNPGDVEAKEETYARVKDFARRFTSVHGTISCRTLLGCDLNTEEGKALFTKNDLANSVCKRCIRTACAIVEETVMEEKNGNREGHNSQLQT
jgi:C_GCAxxG_C_C family probable redox protein